MVGELLKLFQGGMVMEEYSYEAQQVALRSCRQRAAELRYADLSAKLEVAKKRLRLVEEDDDIKWSQIQDDIEWLELNIDISKDAIYQYSSYNI